MVVGEALATKEALVTKGPRTSPRVPPILASQVTPAKSPSFLQPPFSVLSNSEDEVSNLTTTFQLRSRNVQILHQADAFRLAEKLRL